MHTGNVGSESPFAFVSRPSGTGLDRFVRSLWFARGTVDYRRERIAPTGSTVAVIVLGDPIRQTPDDGHGVSLIAAAGFVTGPHDRPVVNEPLGETYAVGVVTTPVGCEALFGRRPATVRGRVVPLESFWPAGAGLRDDLLDASGDQAMAIVDAALLAGLGDPPEGWERCEAAAAALEADPTKPIAQVAASLSVTHNRLNRDFTRIVGLGPRTLASLLRVRRLLAELDVDDEIDWPRRAAELGWYDQAHLIRDFRRYTGVPPTAYVQAQRDVLTRGETIHAAGFVPER